VKPNSRALISFKTARITFDRDGQVQALYDFGMAHLGDRGVACVLHALALDQLCTAVSLRACSLRAPSSASIAVFLELHPRLRHLDLSQNGFSYEAGELILDALQKRSNSSSPAFTKGQPDKLQPTTVHLGSTGLAWGHGGLTVAPPAGNLWALGDSRARFAPSSYEALRSRLEETNRITYNNSTGTRTPSPSRSHQRSSFSKERVHTPSPVKPLLAWGTSRAPTGTTSASPGRRKSSYHSGRHLKGKLFVPSSHSLPAVKPPISHSGALLLPGVLRSARRQGGCEQRGRSMFVLRRKRETE